MILAYQIRNVIFLSLGHWLAGVPGMLVVAAILGMLTVRLVYTPELMAIQLGVIAAYTTWRLPGGLLESAWALAIEYGPYAFWAIFVLAALKGIRSYIQSLRDQEVEFLPKAE